MLLNKMTQPKQDEYQEINGEALLVQIQSAMPDLRGRINANADMSKVTWFRTGGLAEIFFQPDDEEDLAYFLKNLPKTVPITIVGIGSNLLVRDGGIKGVVIRLSAKGFGKVEHVAPNQILAGAALPDRRLAIAARDAEIYGLHFFYGIPGNLGGALKMNGGANGLETADCVVEVYALNRDGERVVLKNADMHYSYRHSHVADDLIFVAALLQGEKGDKAAIQQAMDNVIHHRETVQPIREKTGGSTFQNPKDTSAWKEIDNAGCRGLKIGGAQMSEMHCNFMINCGDASAYDLESLGETVRQRVYENSAILLQWEIQRIGQFAKGQKSVAFTVD